MEVALLELAERGLVEIHDDPLFWGRCLTSHRRGSTSRADRRISLLPRCSISGRPNVFWPTALGVYQRSSARLDIVDTLVAICSARSEFEAAVDGELVSAAWYRRPPFRTMRRVAPPCRCRLRPRCRRHRGGDPGGICPLAVRLRRPGLRRLCSAGGSPSPCRLERARARCVAAMLKAYRRSLEKTLGVAESVWDVIGVRELAWFQTPDQMIVWAMALDLERDLAAMFARANDAPSGEPWFPDWYGTIGDRARPDVRLAGSAGPKIRFTGTAEPSVSRFTCTLRAFRVTWRSTDHAHDQATVGARLDRDPRRGLLDHGRPGIRRIADHRQCAASFGGTGIGGPGVPVREADICTAAEMPTVTPGTFTIGTDNPAYPPYFEIVDPPVTDPGSWVTRPPATASRAPSPMPLPSSSASPRSRSAWIVVPFDNSYRARAPRSSTSTSTRSRSPRSAPRTLTCPTATTSSTSRSSPTRTRPPPRRRR